MITDKRTFLAKIKLRFDRGYYLLKYIRDLALLALVFDQFHLPLWIAAVIVPLLYVLGWLDEKFGIWKAEQRYGAEQLTQLRRELFKRKRS